MPHAFVLKLRPTEAAPLPGAPGVCAHAAFFSLLAQSDAELAERLHTQEERKPFTLCPLFAHIAGNPASREIVGLRVTLLEDALFSTIVNSLLCDGPNAVMRLGEALFQITEVATTPLQHPLADYASYESLSEPGFLPETLAVEFSSPTVFRSQKRDVLWPEPHLIWQSWLRSWPENVRTELGFPQETQFLEWVSEITVIRYRLKTENVPLGLATQEGFIGRCEYGLRSFDKRVRRIVTALAHSSFYTGTGRKTAMGMGQTRILSNR